MTPLCPLQPAPFWFAFLNFIPHSSGRPCVFILILVCYHLFFPLCCCITAFIHKSCSISPRSIHLLHFFPLCYAHFIYSPHSLAFIFILYHSSRAATTCCYSMRVASCLLLHFSQLPLSLPSYRTLYHIPSDTSSHMHLLHAYVLHIYCLIPASTIERYFISISAGLEIEALIEIGM